MFFHCYLYRLKCITRDKQTMFWTLMFPIILATLFNMAFSNLTKAESFSEIQVGIVDSEELKQNTVFMEAIHSASDLFDVTYTSREEADKLLQDNKIEGYIYYEKDLKLAVKESGINETILKSFLDDYKQTTSTIMTIIGQNPAAVQNGFTDGISERTDYLRETSASKSAPDTVVHYFYTLIAMACLYGSFCGLKEVTALQGNLSTQGARINMTPVHKAKMVMASMCAAITVQLFDMIVLLAYLILILKVKFGNQAGYVALTCLVGTITGVTFGTCISSMNKKSEGLKVGILISTSMVMSFLSGMMYDKMKYIVSTKAPILSYLNISTLITDSFYALYYYDTHTRFFINIALLCGFSVVFSIITYLKLRRQRYASI